MATVLGSRLHHQRSLKLAALEQFEVALRRSAELAASEGARDLVAWAKKYLPRYVPLEPCDLHRWLSSELGKMVEKRGTSLCCVAPRGYAKSTWVSIIYVLWCIVHHAEPFIVIASETAEQAQGFLHAVKSELESNAMIAADYPETAGAGTHWTQKQIVTRNGIRVRAIGAGGRIRGIRQREARPTLVIVDDPEGDASGFSAAIRIKINSWFFKAVSNVGSPATNYVVIGTLIHEDCLVGVLSRAAGWVTRTFRAVLRWPTRLDVWDAWERCLRDGDEAGAAFLEANRAAMLEGAEVLWPERETIVDLMTLRAKTTRASFLSEKQNEPIPPGAMRFSHEWFDGDDLWFDGPPENSIAFCAVDPCVGKKGTSGDLAAIVWCWWTRGDRHLYVDAILGRRPPSETNELLVELTEAHRFAWIAYESNGLQGELGADVQNRLVAARLAVPVFPVEHTVSKILRIDQLGPLLSNRNLKFRRRSEGAVALVKQLKYFAQPKLEPYDGPDALQMLVERVTGYLSAAFR